ncbi:MAG: hybrid sensor histidine kinase/response regulator [Candidatus Latescibacteria bacterium]|nr:hybrid sensor histidine kinase/response regulator [Candidatus Latescibacterota bacterium]
MRILLVDDEEAILRSLGEVLKDLGYEVATALDGDEALKQVAALPVDLVISDVKMPRMDGIALLSRLQAQAPDLPVILITGHGDEETAISALQEGARDYLRKPIRVKALLAAIKRVQDQQQLERLLVEERDKLVHASRLASLGTLAAGLAHEINNPATFVKGDLQLLEKSWTIIRQVLEDLPPGQVKNPQGLAFVMQEVPGLISGMQQGMERIIRLVREMSLLSRSEKQDTQRTVVDLGQCIEEALQMERHVLPPRTQVQKVQDTIQLQTRADAQQITQVLMNLLSNAAHALERMPDPTIVVRTRREADWNTIEVEDNGAGIPEEAKPRIFDPFFTTKDVGRGTGLGLSICRGIVQDHGGQIGFESHEGKGTRFWVRLPALA